MKKLTLALLSIIIIVASTNAQTTTGLRIVSTFHIASPGGWDYLSVGPVNDWLYVTR